MGAMSSVCVHFYSRALTTITLHSHHYIMGRAGSSWVTRRILPPMCACVSARGRASLRESGARRRQSSPFTHGNRLSESNLQAEPDVVAERQRPSSCDGQARLHAVLHSVDPLAELDGHRRKLGRGVSWPSAREKARTCTPPVG